MSRPGLAASGPQREVFDSARVKGFLFSQRLLPERQRGLQLCPEGSSLRSLGALGGHKGNIRTRYTHTRGPVTWGKVGGRESDG